MDTRPFWLIFPSRIHQAHNLEDSAREAGSAKISLRALSSASREMQRLGAECERDMVVDEAVYAKLDYTLRPRHSLDWRVSSDDFDDHIC